MRYNIHPLSLACLSILHSCILPVFPATGPAQKLNTDLHSSNSIGSKVQINRDMVLVIDGKKVFPIGFTMPPPPDALAPSGRNAIAELAEAGATFLRTGVMGESWSDATIEKEQAWQDAAARHGMHCWVF